MIALGSLGPAVERDDRPSTANASANKNDGDKVERKQLSERDQTAMTIEFLRARLLSERAASKAAREEVQRNAKRVLELQNQLQLEIEQRRKAEAAMEEVIAKLRLKVSSDSHNFCQEASSKHIEEEPKSSTVSFQCNEKEDRTSHNISSADVSSLLQRQNTVDDQGIYFEKELIFNEAHVSNEVQPSLKNGDALNRNVEVAVYLNTNIEKLGEEIASNQVQPVTTEVSADSETSNQARERISNKLVIEEQLRSVWTRIEEEIAALPEGQSQTQFLRLKLHGLVDHVARVLESKLQEDQENYKLVRTNFIPSCASSLMQEGVRQESLANEVPNSAVPENPHISENLTPEEVIETNLKSVSSCKADSIFDAAIPQQKEKSYDGASMSMSPTAGIIQHPCPRKPWKADRNLHQTSHFVHDVEAHPMKELVSGGFDLIPGLSGEPLIKDRHLIRPMAPYPIQNAAYYLKMRGQSDVLNTEVGQNHIYRTLSGHALIADGGLAGNTYMGHTEADLLNSPDERLMEGQISFPKGHDQFLVNDFANHANDRAGSVGSSQGYESLSGGLAVRIQSAANEGGEDYATIPGKEGYLLRGTTTFPYKGMELKKRLDGLTYHQEREYQFPIKGNSMNHFYQTAPPKNKVGAQMSKALHDESNSRLGDMIAALQLAKQHIWNSMDQENFPIHNSGVAEDGYGGSAYYVPSPTVKSCSGYPVVEGQHISHGGHKLGPCAAGYLSSQALTMQSSTSAPPKIGQYNILRRSRSTSDAFTMPLSETYHRPRRQVHLGNGITLYTD